MTQSEIQFFFVMLHVYNLKCPSLELPFIYFFYLKRGVDSAKTLSDFVFTSRSLFHSNLNWQC